MKSAKQAARALLGEPRFQQLRRAKNALLMPTAHHPAGGIHVPFAKDQFAAKRCFILGTAPSILQMDLSPLRGDYLATVNRGFLLREHGLERVHFYGLSDVDASAEYGRQIPRDYADYYLTFGRGDYGSPPPSNTGRLALYTPKARGRAMANGFFQTDLQQPLAHSYTVVLHMLQLLVYGGFRDIYLLGVDNDFSSEKLHFYPDSTQEKHNIQSQKIDVCAHNESAFECASAFLQARGVGLFNAGIGGKLETIPRVDFHTLF